MRPWLPSESPKTFFDEKKTYIFCSKVPSKCRKCHFRDPNLKMGFQIYIFCSKVPSKCRKCRFRDPNFKHFSGGNAPGPSYNCVVTMASPSLKSWLRHCTRRGFVFKDEAYTNSGQIQWISCQKTRKPFQANERDEKVYCFVFVSSVKVTFDDFFLAFYICFACGRRKRRKRQKPHALWTEIEVFFQTTSTTRAKHRVRFTY